MDVQDDRSTQHINACGVAEKQFPQMRKCCIYSGIGELQRYQNICSYCKVWNLPPAGENLEVATIFECRRYDFVRRVKE